MNRMNNNNDYIPNKEFGSANYRPNWIRVEYKESTKKMEQRSFGRSLLSFEGRLSLLDYYVVIFMLPIVWFILFVICFACFENENTAYQLLSACSVGLFYIGLAAAIKRCHDTGVSGSRLLFPLYFVYLLFVAGDDSENEYGYPPK